MSDQPNVAPAGAGEQQHAPSGPMGMSAAANILAGLDDIPDAPAEAAPSSDAVQDTIEEPSAEAATGDEPEAAEAEEVAPQEDAEPAAEPAEPGAEEEEDQYVHGNARTRLRDGTVTTVAELKKLADEAREYRAKSPAIAEQERQLSERAAQLAQQEQFVQQIVPQAVQVLKAYIPPAPDPELLDPRSEKYDTLLHYEQQQRHTQALMQLQQMQGAYDAQQTAERQKAETSRAEALRAHMASEQKALLEKIPDIAVPEKRDAIYKGFVGTAERYGFTAEDVSQVSDHRLLHMVHDLSSKAAAYDKLMAQQKAAAKKVAASPPVQQPGPRAPQADAAQRGLDEKFRKFREGGGGMTRAAEVLALLD